MSRIRLYYQSIVDRCLTEAVRIVSLSDESQTKTTNFLCSEAMAGELKLREERQPITHILLPEVMAKMIGKEKLGNYEINIAGALNPTGISFIYDKVTHERFQIRTSDAVLLSYITGIPMYMDENDMKNLGISYDPKTGNMKAPICVIDTGILEKELKKSIENEDYERAAVIKRELDNRAK